MARIISGMVSAFFLDGTQRAAVSSVIDHSEMKSHLPKADRGALGSLPLSRRWLYIDEQGDGILPTIAALG